MGVTREIQKNKDKNKLARVEGPSIKRFLELLKVNNRLAWKFEIIRQLHREKNELNERF